MDFSTLQEVVALTVAVGAALYVLRKLTGWPRRKRPRDRLVQPTGRLARGLEKARRKSD